MEYGNAVEKSTYTAMGHEFRSLSQEIDLTVGEAEDCGEEGSARN
jgi:hypothetical protein